MRTTAALTPTTLVLAAVLALGACKKNTAPEQLPPAPVATTSDTGAAQGQAGYGAAQPGTQGHFAQAMQGQDTIYFDLDRYDIDSADIVALQTQAQYLQQYPNARATIQGHTDERGTREYNLALGERRANAAKNYMVSLGIPADRLNTVSFGKERPTALGSSEQAYAQNRRAVTVLIN